MRLASGLSRTKVAGLYNSVTSNSINKTGSFTSSSSFQVNDLKQQLATQEIELNKKNEEADKLIEIVGIETERVSREKAIADEEELKVNQINREVSTKQKDCEEDLKKAEPGKDRRPPVGTHKIIVFMSFLLNDLPLKVHLSTQSL